MAHKPVAQKMQLQGMTKAAPAEAQKFFASFSKEEGLVFLPAGSPVRQAGWMQSLHEKDGRMAFARAIGLRHKQSHQPRPVAKCSKKEFFR